MGDQKTQDRPQTQQQPGQRDQQQDQNRPMGGQEQANRQPSSGGQAQSGARQNPMPGGDQGKVGQDTDGDGKVVKPGQTPGQSGGKGLS